MSFNTRMTLAQQASTKMPGHRRRRPRGCHQGAQKACANNTPVLSPYAYAAALRWAQGWASGAGETQPRVLVLVREGRDNEGAHTLRAMATCVAGVVSAASEERVCPPALYAASLVHASSRLSELARSGPVIVACRSVRCALQTQGDTGFRAAPVRMWY